MQTFSDWTALTVKEEVLGKTLNGAAPERPFGVDNLVNEEAKLLLSWLAMVEAAAAIFN